MQDIVLVPAGDRTKLPHSLATVSKIHRSLENVFQGAGQGSLGRGPRGGFCSFNPSVSFEQLMDCLMEAVQNFDFSVEILVDVHASRLIAEKSDESGEPTTQTRYSLPTASVSGTQTQFRTGSDLLEIYLEWLEKYPISAFIEPFGPCDVGLSKELLHRGDEVLKAKSLPSVEGSGDGTPLLLDGETLSEGVSHVDRGGGSNNADHVLLRVIADESVTNPAQATFVNEQRGANAIALTTSKISTVSECISLAVKARDMGWSLFVSSVAEDELEWEFLVDIAVGLRAEYMMMGGLACAGTVAACRWMLGKQDNW